MEIPWELLGGGGVGAVATLAILMPLLKRKNGAPCPIPEHVAQLATHAEAITTLKNGQAAIFERLNRLPGEVATATAAATGVAIAAAMHRK